MKKLALATSIVALAVSAMANADYYSAWTQSDDDTVKIDDSFNKDYRTTVTEDNDITKSYQKSEDNDITTSYKHSEDNDVTSSWKYDSEVVSPTLTSLKKQDQQAGHKAATQVSGSATGHSQDVKGGPVIVSVGAEDTYNAGPVITNNNNFAPNMATIYGSNGGPIMQSGSFVGGDVKHYSLGDFGNTSAVTAGDVGNQSGAVTHQEGDSANAIDDDMVSNIQR